MMSDHSVSERHYNKHGNVTSQKSYPSMDIDHAMKKIEILLDKFKKDSYLQTGEAAPKLSRKSSSKSESPTLKKRSSKEAKNAEEEEKKAEPKATGVRRKKKEVEKATK